MVKGESSGLVRPPRLRTGEERGASRLWNLFDLTPAGRGTDWDEQLSYS
jgi:hypothetical protein